MNIIFLDVDGVLNSRNKRDEVYEKTHKPHSGHSYPFDEKCLENLKLLVQETNSKIVITSVWRKNEEKRRTLLNVLKEYNLDKEVIGYTPVLNKKRGIEIKQFLIYLKETPNFVIIDDDSDMEELMPYLIKTNGQVGLTYENVQDAIIKLNKPPVKRYKRSYNML